jgi:hypothetical protein
MDLPDDPETWSDEQWIAWLEEVDAEAAPQPEGHPLQHKSPGIQLLGAAMLGMHRAIYGDTEPEIVMIVDAEGDPMEPEELEVHIVPEDPDASTVTVRPWLHDDGHDDGHDHGHDDLHDDGLDHGHEHRLDHGLDDRHDDGLDHGG